LSLCFPQGTPKWRLTSNRCAHALTRMHTHALTRMHTHALTRMHTHAGPPTHARAHQRAPLAPTRCAWVVWSAPCLAPVCDCFARLSSRGTNVALSSGVAFACVPVSVTRARSAADAACRMRCGMLCMCCTPRITCGALGGLLAGAGAGAVQRLEANQSVLLFFSWTPHQFESRYALSVSPTPSRGSRGYCEAYADATQA